MSSFRKASYWSKGLLVLGLLLAVGACDEDMPGFPIISPLPRESEPPSTAPRALKAAVYFSKTPQGSPAMTIEQQLIRVIQEARYAINMDMPTLDSPAVIEALNQARLKGRSVQICLNDDPQFKTRIQELKDLGLDVRTRSVLHQHKYVILDGLWIWTGSYVPTRESHEEDDSGAVLFESEHMANQFEKAFEDRYASGMPYRTIGLVNTAEKTRLFARFTPDEDVDELVAQEIKKARSEVRFLSGGLNSEKIADALNAVERVGVSVRGVLESSGARGSLYRNFKVDTNPHLMSHDVFIIDGKTVLIGSDGVANKGPSHVQVIESQSQVAQAYLAEFDRIYALAR
ncbi:MAG: phospholipase D-like domain-containing protein [Candidatus Sericytochromatia bacterium]